MKKLISIAVIAALTGCVSAPHEGDKVSYLKGGFLKQDSAIAKEIANSQQMGNGATASNVAGQLTQSTNVAGSLGGNVIAAIAVGELVSMIPTHSKKTYQDDDYIVRVVKGGGLSKGFTLEVKYNEKMRNMKANDQVSLVKDKNGNLTLMPVTP